MILYLRGQMKGLESLIPVGYLDVDWVSNWDDCKSISAYVFLLAGGPIVWSSHKQKSVSTSLCKAELYTLSLATTQALYIWRYFEPLRIHMDLVINIYCNSQSALVVNE